MIDFSKIIKSTQSFKYFYTEVLGYDWDYVHEKIYENAMEKRSVTQVSRGHGKSELLSVAYTLWKAAFHRPYTGGKPYHILIASATMRQAIGLMDRIKNTMDRVDILNFLDAKEHLGFDEEFAKMIKKRKKDNSVMVLTSNNVLIEAAPFTPSLRSRHPHEMILDDVLKDEESAASTLNEEKAWRIMSKVVLPMTETNNSDLRIIGTPMSLTDPLQRLSEDESFKAIKLPACKIDKDGKLFDPIWPTNFPVEKLERIRKTIGELAFQQEYMLNPIGGDLGIIPEKYLKEQTLPLKAIWLHKPREGFLYYLSVDVAMSSADRADESVFTTLELNWETQEIRYVNVEAYKGLGAEDAHLEKIRSLNKIWDYELITPEQNGISYGLCLRAQDDTEFGFKVVPLTVGRNKDEIISQLITAVVTKRMYLPSHVELLKQLKNYRSIRVGTKTVFQGVGAHDDYVMSLAIGVHAINEFPNVKMEAEYL